MSRRALLASGVIAASGLGSLAYWLSRDGQRAPEQGPQLGPSSTGLGETFADRYDKCHALLIGIAQAYQGSGHAVLAKPVKEVEAIERRLQANDAAHWNWEGSITKLTEGKANKKAIEDELSRLEREPGKEDGVLLYYSGHGIGHLHQWFFVPAGTTGPDPNRNEGYVDEDRIANFIDRCPAKHVLVVLDCCYAGTMFKPPKGAGRPGTPSQDDTRLAGEFLRHPAKQILTAANQEAADGPFCKAFLEALTPKAADPRSAFMIADQLQAHILTHMQLTVAGSSVQIPRLIQRSGQGSFVFFLPK